MVDDAECGTNDAEADDLRLLISATRSSLGSPCGSDDEEATSVGIPSVLELAAALDALPDLDGGGGGGGGSLDTFHVGSQYRTQVNVILSTCGVESHRKAIIPNALA